MSNKYSYQSLLAMAWPIILANAAVPLLGLVDTTIIGNVGDTQQLGAIALGSLIFSFIYWSFGFLRMSTTGFTAQAAGASNTTEIAHILIRALLLSFVIGSLIFTLQRPLATTIFYLFDGSAAVESHAANYFSIRIWGAPATLATFALMGTLIGLGKSREVLIVQLFLNALNIILDVLFAGYFSWGVKGIALGTLISEWMTVFFAAAIVYKQAIAPLPDKNKIWQWQRILVHEKIVKLVIANRDIFIRTVFLIFSFAWFTDQSAGFGDTQLAANHILLQFISFSAFFLDGFAFVAEALVGAAIGSKKLSEFDLSVKRSSILAAITATGLALVVLLGGHYFVILITDISDVRETAMQYLWYSAIYIFASFAAFQLDGIFIGAVRAAQMRNASVLSSFFFLAISWPLCLYFGNTGLWLAFVFYVISRAAALGYYYPMLRRELKHPA